MLADEMLSRLIHRRYVERTRDAPRAPHLQCEIRATIEDSIEIVPSDSRGTGVEIIRDLLGGENRDRMWTQMGIQGIANRVGIPNLAQVDVGDLGTRMNSGIGTARALHEGRLAREGLYCCREYTLHSHLIGLNLPAGEGRAVVFNDEFIAWHRQSNRAPGLIWAPRRNSSALIGCFPAR